jgi:hypothetical protein
LILAIFPPSFTFIKELFSKTLFFRSMIYVLYVHFTGWILSRRDVEKIKYLWKCDDFDKIQVQHILKFIHISILYRVYQKKGNRNSARYYTWITRRMNNWFSYSESQAFSYWMTCFSCQVEHVRGRIKNVSQNWIFSPLCLIKTMHNKRKSN